MNFTSTAKAKTGIYSMTIPIIVINQLKLCLPHFQKID